MVRKDGKSFVQFAANIGNFTRILGERFLSPAVGDGPKKSDERGGGGQDDILVHALFQEG